MIQIYSHVFNLTFANGEVPLGVKGVKGVKEVRGVKTTAFVVAFIIHLNCFSL